MQQSISFINIFFTVETPNTDDIRLYRSQEKDYKVRASKLYMPHAYT